MSKMDILMFAACFGLTAGIACLAAMIYADLLIRREAEALREEFRQNEGPHEEISPLNAGGGATPALPHTQAVNGPEGGMPAGPLDPHDPRAMAPWNEGPCCRLCSRDGRHTPVRLPGYLCALHEAAEAERRRRLGEL